jgi:hypothetical protein
MLKDGSDRLLTDARWSTCSGPVCRCGKVPDALFGLSTQKKGGTVNAEGLRDIVEDLINVVHLQAKELEKLVAHVEQVTTHLPYQHQFALVASELSELHQRIKKLRPSP